MQVMDNQDYFGKKTVEQGGLVVRIDYLPKVNYAMMVNGLKTCSSLVIENTNAWDISQVEVTLVGQMVKESACRLEELRSGQVVQLTAIDVEPDFQMLSETTESVETDFTLSVSVGGESILSASFPIRLLAYDEWAGSSVMPEHLAAFVVPNSPMLSSVKAVAARYLEKWTGSSALDEYQTQDRNRVRSQVAALYEALRQEGIVYSAPPASFEETGQRIRMADKVLTEKTATCLDTVLLMASCLESIGIYPVVIILHGHALVGAWLAPKVFPQMVCDDVSYLLKEMADGNHNLVVLESTAITASQPVSFEDAVAQAVKVLADERQFLYFVDLHRCRLGNIRPMPQRVLKDGQWLVVDEGVEHALATEGASCLNHYDLRLEEQGMPLTKQMLWERKLLDFSLRNNLLNTRLGRKVVPFISFEIEFLEDHLQNGEDYTITPTPGKRFDPNEDGMYDSAVQASEYQQYVTELIGEHKIASYLTDNELEKALKFVYRTARTSLEENGANSLFLALGMLRWYESAKSLQARYAPILLLPVDIIRKSKGHYVLRKRDEDIILNITLVELLKQNFNISLDGLKELPKDESGVDVKKIFTYFRRAIIEQKRWNVVEEAMLGLFSFNKFVMWNDIHTNADKLQENVIVSSLIEQRDKQGHDEEAVDARHIDRDHAPMDFAIPLDVDSSQMEAIVESGRGRSFILHGPPGTGKSQTITNMIANALYQGKRVLFVAEKMAALSVVQSRLEKIGLAAFCMELHSNKATKKHFLEQMDQVLRVTKIKSPEEYARLSEELFRERRGLISYMEALHRKGDSGLSLYQCITEYLAIDGEEAEGPLPDRQRLTADYISQCRDMVEPIEAVIRIVQHIKDHPLSGLEPAGNRQSTLDTIRTMLHDFRKTYDDFSRLQESLRSRLGLDIQTDADFEWLGRCVDDLDLEIRAEALHDEVCPTCQESILRLNVQQARAEWDEVMQKWFLPRFFSRRKYLQAMQPYGHVTAENLEGILTLVEQWQEVDQTRKANATEMVSFAREHDFSHADRAQLYDTFVSSRRTERRQEFMEDARHLIDMNGQLNTLVNLYNANTICEQTKATIANRVDCWLDHYQMVNDWYHWVDMKQRLLTADLKSAVTMLEAGCTPAVTIDRCLKAVYHQLISDAIDDNDQLRMFNGLKFRQQIEQYKRDTQRFQELSKEELYSKLASRIPVASTATSVGSEVSILKRNIANGGRGNSIRAILDSIPTLLPRLCPCMLMSPISVAQYIDLDADKFDLVIFDEASQMPTSEAVGAIARGKALVVVGDSRQMPPTSFFTTTQVDEEEADIDDMESILDDCITLSLCEHQLNWHYRSKHESLIAFSNSQYYGNNLLTFPSIDDQEAKVRLVPVDGVYDKGHTRSNPQESKAIVKEIIRRLSDPELRRYSIGVVSFSKVQGDLIEDDLTEELDRRPDLKEVAYNGREPIFVKNLENVQGDERDVILFSVGYGADKHGKVSMNFGPLNNAGGERRLNVAVSRARYEMIVFSTLKASQIDLNRSHARGVEGLKAFLEFAETGRLPLVQGSSREAEKGVMVDQISKALQEHGYVTKTFVGRSSFKVDVAVATAEQPDKYILGILCDGRAYYETKTTRDREIVQPGVLAMLNWQVMRVYSIDWYENQQRALSQILDRLEEVMGLRQPEEEPEDEAPAYTFNPDKIKPSVLYTVSRNEEQTTYREAEFDVMSINKEAFRPTDPRYVRMMKFIVEVEQPITEPYLCKRLARVLGFAHAGVNIQKTLAVTLPRLYRDPLVIDGVYSVWLNEKSARDYTTYRSPSPRAINEIPAVELVNVIKEVLREEFSLPKDTIPTVAARKLGFNSSGAKIGRTILQVVDYLESASVISVTNGMVSLKE